MISTFFSYEIKIDQLIEKQAIITLCQILAIGFLVVCALFSNLE